MTFGLLQHRSSHLAPNPFHPESEGVGGEIVPGEDALARLAHSPAMLVSAPRMRSSTTK
jgi:hypothetical protein